MATISKSAKFFFTRRPLISSLYTRRFSVSARMMNSTNGEKPRYQIIQDVGDFAELEAKRPPFNPATPIKTTQSPFPAWKYGDGVPDGTTAVAAACSITHHEIDPYGADRPTISNYRLLISGIAPRPIGFVSTLSLDGKSENLAPFSYFQVVDHDPPMFILGFSSRPGREKDTLRNLKETGECVINTVSENMIEAVNASSIDAPFGVSEWNVSGLTKAASSTVKPARVAESVFSIEGKVIEIKEFSPHSEGMSVGGVVLIKASRFWVREGVADQELSHIELEKLRPIAQVGRIGYGRITEVFERPRTRWVDEVGKSEKLQELKRRNGLGKR
ncbi:flavin reductase family protein [Aspergillus stella-maris]|uniref:flavin reductase family protein n=1 Tax=Aspergillus stella-maris TaxID=1810926 RepID=UPI003CCDB863